MINLPLLKYECRKIKKPIFGNHVLILIQHLLRDSISLVRAFEKCGAEQEDIFVIGIPYSSKSEVIKELSSDFKVFTPSYPIDDEVKKIIKKAVEVCKKKNKKLLIIEDGGYAVPIIHLELNEALKYCIGAVEQTTNGVWRDEEVILNFPVLTIAFSELKKELESPEIGNAVVRNIQMLLSKRGDFIRGKKVILAGYGTIGRQIAESLRNDGCVVGVSDPDPKKLIAARFKGFNTDSMLNLVKNGDIIVGASGRRSIGIKEILSAKNNAILVNASSKRVEIDVEVIENLKETKNKIDGVGTEYELINRNRLLLLADGYPVNFYNSESVPDKIIDVILTELFLCATELIKREFSKTIHKSLQSIINEDELADTFTQLHIN
ncbi:MAG: hypothetical protein CVT90_00965 [Candidatus Altiarchaeales archaeon HGW-Altiarchaeales-3]|nr:MAG: hypothetical protein CVT90_00965 [Candidatus Altiarchaeales archaeon HGW-Altiarchaeales-3]